MSWLSSQSNTSNANMDHETDQRTLPAESFGRTRYHACPWCASGKLLPNTRQSPEKVCGVVLDWCVNWSLGIEFIFDHAEWAFFIPTYLFKYLEKMQNAWIVIKDPTTFPDVDMSVFKEGIWKAMPNDVTEAIPPKATKSWGKDVSFCTPRSSRLPLRNVRVVGAEFVAMKLGMETMQGTIHYKWHVMGVALWDSSW